MDKRVTLDVQTKDQGLWSCYKFLLVFIIGIIMHDILGALSGYRKILVMIC